MPNQAEANLSALIESTEDLIWSVDLDDRLMTCNRAFQRAFEASFGIQVEAGMPREGLLPPEKGKLFPPLYARALSQGPFRTEYILRDGRTLELSFNPIVADGHATGVSVFGKDITNRKAAEQASRESTDSLAEAQRLGGLGSYHLDIPAGVWTSSQVLDEIFGIDKQFERTVASWTALIHPDDRAMMDAYFAEEVLGNRNAFNREYRILRQTDGAERWVHGKGKLVFDAQGQPLRMHGVIKDITERKRSEIQLRASEARYHTVFQTSLDSVTITHLDSGKYVDVNQAFLDTTGFDRDEVIDHTVLEINVWADPRDRKNFAELLRQPAQCQNLETRFRKKNGELFSGLVSAAVIELDGVPCIVSFMRDISGAKAAEDKIRDLAFYDPLTHLPNRRLLMERVRQTLAAGTRSNRKCALLFVDLDHFKILNDTLGHETGDLMLQETARRLVTCIHDADTVARQGGDEFVVMLEDLSEIPEEAAAQAEAVGESILAAINQPYLLRDREYRSTASIGITVFGDHRGNANDLMQQADIAMYQAKAAGRNTSRFFAPALQAAVHARAALEEDLRQAIQGNQFVLFYQPQVDASGLIGAEALIRWNHPRRGLLPPGEFISLAEETGLILPLGEWVLVNACTQIAAWALHSNAAPISIAVNISARQFRQPDFVEQVLAVLKRTGANPQHLGLELTESMLLENVEDVIAKMTPPQVPRPALLPGRLRHRLFVSLVPQAPAPGPIEDRPLLRPGHPRRHRQPRHRPVGHLPGPGFGFGGDRRGRGNHRATRSAHRPRLLFLPGLPLQPPAPPGRFPAALARCRKF